MIKFTFYTAVLLHPVSLLHLSTTFCMIKYIYLFEAWLLTPYARMRAGGEAAGRATVARDREVGRMRMGRDLRQK